jgi:hypothetical protein
MTPGAALDVAIARCRAELASIEAKLRSGHPDLEGLLRALVDWSRELRLLQNEQRNGSRRHEKSSA